MKRSRDWADKKAEKLILQFWEDIEGHWYGRKAPIAKLEARIASALRQPAPTPEKERGKP